MNNLLISARQVRTRLARRQHVLLLDCRGAGSRGDGVKVAGAVSAARVSSLDLARRVAPDGCVVVYAEHGWEQSAVDLVLSLRAAGVEDARILSGGLSGWIAEGLPTEPTRTAAHAG